MEYDRTPSAIRDDLCDTDFKFANVYLTVPNGPGLGIDINEKTLRKLSSGYAGSELSSWQKFNTDWRWD